ncbi:MAG TPA: hypothetical protein VHU83_20850 [Bryobacteraceae bacterium]|nr:hypothetical protein [Bryobacteraceae bacterium]
MKFERAKEHFGALDTEIRDWVGTGPMAIAKEKDAEGRRHIVFAEIVNPPPLNRWALIAGDCVHNLRSALDSLVYGIAIHETGLNPPADERALQFPITSSPDKFKEQKNRIKSLSPAVQSAIEKAQPYNVPHPEFPPALELLGILNNFDKHRTLNVMAAVPHSASVEMIHSRQGAASSVTVHRTGVEGKTEILSFTMEPPDPDLSYKCVAMIAICVAHPPGPSKSPFSELAGVLHALIEEVERIVNCLEAVVGQIPGTAPINVKQTAHFTIDNGGQITPGRLAKPID